ncbi:MAG: hypothetical protein V4719_29670 [Planctomycetota bacterium]
MLIISYTNREEQTADNYDAAVAELKDRFRYATFNKSWEPFGADYERQLVWANASDAACDLVGFRAVAQIVRPLPAGGLGKGMKPADAASLKPKKKLRSADA